MSIYRNFFSVPFKSFGKNDKIKPTVALLASGKNLVETKRWRRDKVATILYPEK